MSALIGSLWPYIAAAIAGLLALWQFGRSQKKAGVNQEKVKQAEARNANLGRIKDAAIAGEHVRTQPDDPGVPDPYDLDAKR